MTLDPSGSVCTFRPSRPLTYLLAGAAILSGGDAVATTDPAGRLILAAVAVLLATIAAADAIFSPRLAAGPAGLAIRSPGLRARLAWNDVDVIRVDEHSHLGLSNRALEIEAGPTLVVFGRRGLGCDPRVAFEELFQCASRAPEGSAHRLLARAGLERDGAPDDDDEQHDGDSAET
jgi:hypothetical protein